MNKSNQHESAMGPDEQNVNEFEPPEIVNRNEKPPANFNGQNISMQNYTFYSGQNSKFFDKRILISQKKNRKVNQLGVSNHDSQLQFKNAQEATQDNYSPKIKKGVRSI